MAKVVVNLGVLQCTMGDAPVPITILPANKVMGCNQPMGNIMDHKPAVNIMPFGTVNEVREAELRQIARAAALRGVALRREREEARRAATGS